jgi:hypothetical protein
VNDSAGAEAFLLTLGEFRDAVRRLGDTEVEIVGGLRGLLFDRDSARVILWLTACHQRSAFSRRVDLRLCFADSHLPRGHAPFVIREMLGWDCKLRGIRAM